MPACDHQNDLRYTLYFDLQTELADRFDLKMIYIYI